MLKNLYKHNKVYCNDYIGEHFLNCVSTCKQMLDCLFNDNEYRKEVVVEW